MQRSGYTCSACRHTCTCKGKIKGLTMYTLKHPLSASLRQNVWILNTCPPCWLETFTSLVLVHLNYFGLKGNQRFSKNAQRAIKRSIHSAVSNICRSPLRIVENLDAEILCIFFLITYGGFVCWVAIVLRLDYKLYLTLLLKWQHWRDVWFLETITASLIA